jgi:hypothetical protein
MTDITDDVIELENGKYRIELTGEGYKAFRYGEPWPAAQGVKLIGIMANELLRQRERQAVPDGFCVTEKDKEAIQRIEALLTDALGTRHPAIDDWARIRFIVDAAPPANTVKQEAVIPEGRKLVPIEPTSEMLKAAYVDYESDKYTGPSSMYKAMLSAAPDCPHPIVEELTK